MTDWTEDEVELAQRLLQALRDAEAGNALVVRSMRELVKINLLIDALGKQKGGRGREIREEVEARIERERRLSSLNRIFETS